MLRAATPEHFVDTCLNFPLDLIVMSRILCVQQQRCMILLRRATFDSGIVKTVLETWRSGPDRAGRPRTTNLKEKRKWHGRMQRLRRRWS
jgi:hypothetical protein